MAEDPILSAQVILRGPSGRTATVPITSANLSEFTPSPEAVAAATRYFAGLGFSVGQMVGNSFSITGKSSTFEKTFGVKLRRRGRGMEAVRADRTAALELPLEKIPSAVSQTLEAVTFTAPPDFGPTKP
jgi:hypothetical protein